MLMICRGWPGSGLHVDLTSNAADRDQEIDRLLALGARQVDIGQTGAESKGKARIPAAIVDVAF